MRARGSLVNTTQGDSVCVFVSLSLLGLRQLSSLHDKFNLSTKEDGKKAIRGNQSNLIILYVIKT